MAANDTTIAVTAPINVDEPILAGGQSADKVEEKQATAGKARKRKARAAGTQSTANPRIGRSTTAAVDNKATKQKTAAARQTKADIVLKKLRLARGATIESLMEATSWQAHSVRGFLSAVVRKKLGLTLVSEVGKDGVRRYRIDGDNGGTADTVA